MAKSKVTEDAYKILEALAEQGVGNVIGRPDILKATGLTEDEYNRARPFLSGQGHIKGTVGGLNGSDWLTSAGLAFYEGQHGSAGGIQAGAIFMGPVEGSQIQAFANAVESNVQQLVQQAQPEDLRETLSQTVEEMFNELQADLNRQQTAAYSDLIDAFRAEIQNEAPDPSRLHGIVSKLFFLGDVEDTISFGERLFYLGAKVAPYLSIVLAHLDQLT